MSGQLGETVSGHVTPCPTNGKARVKSDTRRAPMVQYNILCVRQACFAQCDMNECMYAVGEGTGTEREGKVFT